MELKGTRDRSDFDSKDSDSAKSAETPKPPPAEVRPERRAPVFDLGIIYNRHETPPALRPIAQERDRVEPEVAQGLTLGTPEQRGLKSLPNAAEQAHIQANLSEAAMAQEEDDDESSSEDKDSKPAPPLVRPPLPVRRFDTVEPASPPVINASESPAAPSAHVPVEAAYPSFGQLTGEVPPPQTPPIAEQYTFPPAPEQTPAAFAVAPNQPAEQTPPPTAGAGGGNNRLPPPPPETFASPGQPEPGRWGSEMSQPVYQSASQSFNAYRPNLSDVVTKRHFENEMADRRRAFAAKMILAVALTWYLTRRPIKPLRKQVGALQENVAQQNEQISRLTYEQQAAQQRITEQQRQIEQFTHPQYVPFRQEAMPPHRPQSVESARPVVAEQAKVIGLSGEEVALQPGQRYEIAGAYGAVFNKENKLVPDAIQYGEEYHRDRLRERAPTPFGARDARFTSGAGSAGGFGQPVGSSSGQILPSGQIPTDHTLPMNAAGQTPNQEAQHLLEGPKPNPVVSAITSPWLWLGVGILLIAFFVAATV